VMVRMVLFLFITILISELLLAGVLILSFLNSDMRVWPPSQNPGLLQFLALAFNHTAKVCTIPLGILDWNSCIMNHWLRFVFGALFIATGILFALWGTRSLGTQMSWGKEDRLITSGAYRYSRNPQYVGWGTFFIGYALVCNSLLTFITTAVGLMLYFTASFVEEPWLSERYGSQYEKYKSQVPRFIGLP